MITDVVFSCMGKSPNRCSRYAPVSPAEDRGQEVPALPGRFGQQSPVAACRFPGGRGRGRGRDAAGLLQSAAALCGTHSFCVPVKWQS